MISSDVISNKKLVGLDFTEYNPRKKDPKVYDLSASITRSLIFN
jgi:arginase family enzyme